MAGFCPETTDAFVSLARGSTLGWAVMGHPFPPFNYLYGVPPSRLKHTNSLPETT